ncbi:hypothetical protein IMZ31_22395 (plasmid) [Pontibacillus sp. ALD_SL1]|uniref:hypothetical protein n=1 Tax=Pontibacillus sp. ALD_SL1 TaxID=2777185 RepID=UPI001A973527|nr:hypothetical protein [Pontibacillus sp. ALD_SL1]QST02206.1 hypothetical protein IMZ31_22395 [Pontibacillus sp. ALD_SL1]
MTKTQNVLEKWDGVEFVSSTGKTEQFKSFFRSFKSAVKEQAGESFEVVSCSAGHFYVSGFLKHKESGGFVYFSTGDVRGIGSQWATHLLVRTAEHEKDYTGGRNHYSTLMELGENAIRLMDLQQE